MTIRELVDYVDRAQKKLQETGALDESALTSLWEVANEDPEAITDGAISNGDIYDIVEEIDSDPERIAAVLSNAKYSLETVDDELRSYASRWRNAFTVDAINSALKSAGAENLPCRFIATWYGRCQGGYRGTIDWEPGTDHDYGEAFSVEKASEIAQGLQRNLEGDIGTGHGYYKVISVTAMLNIQPRTVGDFISGRETWERLGVRARDDIDEAEADDDFQDYIDGEAYICVADIDADTWQRVREYTD